MFSSLFTSFTASRQVEIGLDRTRTTDAFRRHNRISEQAIVLQDRDRHIFSLGCALEPQFRDETLEPIIVTIEKLRGMPLERSDSLCR